MTTRTYARPGVVVASALFVITVAVFFRVPLLPDIGRDLVLNAAGIGALGSAFALGRLLTDIPAGSLVDRLAPHVLMVGASLAVAFGSGLIAAAQGQPAALFGFFVVGVGSTLALTTAQAHFAMAPRERRGMSLGVFAAALLVGQTVGPALSGLLAPRTGWRVSMSIAALIVVVLAVPLARVRGTTRSSREPTAPGVDRGTPLIWAVLYLLPAAQFAVGAAVLQTLIPIVGDAELGFGADTIGLALGLGGISRLVAALASGKVSDVYGRKTALIPGLALQFAGVAVFAAWSGTTAWLAAIVLLTLGSVSVNVGTTILADLSEGGRLGARLGAFRFIGDLGFIVAPLAAGVLYEAFNRTVAMWPFVAFAGLVLVLSVVVVPETLDRRTGDVG